jgi:hypothetical protein
VVVQLLPVYVEAVTEDGFRGRFDEKNSMEFSGNYREN